MKKLLILGILIILTGLFASCASSGAASTDSGGSVSADVSKTEVGFAPVYDSVALTMNAPAAPIVEKLGNPLSYFEAPSCAFNGLDKTYTYAGIQLLTYPVEETDYVYSVVFMDDTVSTAEGVALSDTLDKVKSTYGNDYKQENGMYTYTKGGSTLSFLTEDGAVTSIEYDAITK